MGWPDDFHFREFSLTGFYEWRTLALARALVPTGGCIVEIGANVGTETVGLADLVGPSGRVHAFEPLSRNADLLALNGERFSWGNVEIHRLALSDKVGTRRFSVPPAESSGTGHLVPRDLETGAVASPGYSDFEDVEVSTLDHFTGHIGTVHLVTSDTEGEEVRVLRGARQTLERSSPPIVLEASPKLLLRAGSSLNELTQVLEDLNYQPFVVGRFGLSRVTRKVAADMSNAANWLCLPAAKAQLSAGRARRSIIRCGWAPRVCGLNPLQSSFLSGRA